MGLFDWLKGDRGYGAASAAAPPPGPSAVPADGAAARRFSTAREDLFDLAGTRVLAELFAVPRNQRDDGWHARFFDAAWHGSVQLASPEPFTGPDFFPYLRLEVPHAGAFDSQSLGNIAPALLERGVGAAFFASPDDPPESAQFVFSMGRVDAMLRFDNAEGDPADLAELATPTDADVYATEPTADGHERLVTRKDHQVMVGAPSRAFLPPATARALFRHLRDGWKIDAPRVGLMVDPAARPTRSLIIGKRQGDFAPDVQVDQAARMLLWYLTPRQSLMLLPDSMELDELVPLESYFDPA